MAMRAKISYQWGGLWSRKEFIIWRSVDGHINPLTAGAAYIRVLIFYQPIKYHILNMLKIKCDINQQDLKRVDLHFVKSE